MSPNGAGAARTVLRASRRFATWSSRRAALQRPRPPFLSGPCGLTATAGLRVPRCYARCGARTGTRWMATAASCALALMPHRRRRLDRRLRRFRAGTSSQPAFAKPESTTATSVGTSAIARSPAASATAPSRHQPANHRHPHLNPHRHLRRRPHRHLCRFRRRHLYHCPHRLLVLPLGMCAGVPTKRQLRTARSGLPTLSATRAVA